MLAKRLDDLRLIGLLANPHGSLGQLDEALRYAARALVTYKELGEKPPAMVLYRIGITRHQRSEETAALRALQRGEALALAQHDETILVFVRWVRATVLANLGRYQEAFTALAAAESSGKGEEAFARSRIPNTYGAFYADLGLWHESLEHNLESLEVIQSMSGSRSAFLEPYIHTLLNLAENHFALGSPESATLSINRITQLMPEAEYARFRYKNRLHYVQALQALACEAIDVALESAEACLAEAAVYRAPKYEIRGHLVKGQALSRLGNAEAAKTEFITAAKLSEQLGYPVWAWRSWTAASTIHYDPLLRQYASSALEKLLKGLDAKLRERFLRTATKIGS
jgi:tetratricopeptide (TPR) repeat protein